MKDMNQRCDDGLTISFICRMQEKDRIMKMKTVKRLMAVMVLVVATESTVYAASPSAVNFSVGAANVLEDNATSAGAASTTASASGTEATASVAVPAVENTESGASQSSSRTENEQADAALTETQTEASAEGTETAGESEQASVNVAAGAGFISQTVPVSMEDYDDPDDAEEENGGGSYGYTHLGIARVEDHLNVRQTADDNSKIVGKMSNDSGCEIIGVEGNKAHIISGSVEGYVSMDYLLSGQAAVDYADSIVKLLATVSADGLKVRAVPDLEGEIVSMVAYGEELEVVEELDGWVKILYDGQEAYVSAEYVTVGKNLKTALNMSEFLYGEGVSDVRVDLCEYAKQFRGNPYVWGGTSLTHGADCSGFVLSIFAKYGIYLPHSSRAQANMGTKISMSEARPGDLVFYSKGGRINHVAIYIGGGQVIHASSPKTGIRITSAYYRTPTTVRRLIQD